MTGCGTARTARRISNTIHPRPAAFGQRCFWCRWSSRFDASRTRSRWLRQRLLSLYSRSRRSHCAGPKDGGLPTRRGALACGITTVSMINRCGPDLAFCPPPWGRSLDSAWYRHPEGACCVSCARRSTAPWQRRILHPPAPMLQARTQSSIMEHWPVVTVMKPAGAQSSRSWLTA